MSTVTDADVAEVVRRIVQRYANPGRSAYTMLFNVAPAEDFSAGAFPDIVPANESILEAWIDEGSGLAKADIAYATNRAHVIRQEANSALTTPHKQTSDERRRQMARSIVFSAAPTAEDAIEVMLFSRSLTFTPKGDRQVRELWKRGETGWFSAYQPDKD